MVKINAVSHFSHFTFHFSHFTFYFSHFTAVTDTLSIVNSPRYNLPHQAPALPCQPDQVDAFG